MPNRFQDRLNRAAGRAFVGRETEQALFREQISSEEPEYLVLLIHGPGGIGKSSLLRAFSRICDQEDAEAIRLDARAFGENRSAFLSALANSLGTDDPDSVLEALSNRSRRVALLVDTYELCAELEPWLVRHFFPELPANVLVVLAGRQGPSDEWRREPGWASLMRPVSLRNLALKDAEAMLVQAGVPEEDTHRLLAPTHGHPLAVSLVLELYQMRDGGMDLSDAPDVVRALVERLVMKVPSPSHRLALEATSLIHATTEELLSAVLETTDVSEIFEWLRSLSFMESGVSGLFPHDVAREALAADLRWRNPGQYRELHQRARKFYVREMQASDDPVVQRRHSRDLFYLHRDNPVIQPVFRQLRKGDSGTRPAIEDQPTLADHAAIEEMVARHEGPEAARLARAWIEANPNYLTVIRDQKGVPLGGLIQIDLGSADSKLTESDPGTRAAFEHLSRNAPLRDGEVATVFRFWMDHEAYQGLSYVQMTIFVRMVQHYLLTPGLAFTYIPCGMVEELTPIFAYGDIHPLPDATFKIGDRSFGMFGHDWRARPPDVWLELMGQRQVGAVPSSERPPLVESYAVLDQSDFQTAVREALKCLSRPRKLKGNVLLQAALVTRAAKSADEADRVQALCDLLSDSIGRLSGTREFDKAHRALDRTYVRPAGSQEEAADMLDMAYSTFRRHLAKGVEEVSEMLWQKEIGD